MRAGRKALVGLTVLGSLAAGCGTSPAPARPSAEVTVVEAAAAKLVAAGSYRTEFDLKIDIGLARVRLVGESRHRLTDRPASATVAVRKDNDDKKVADVEIATDGDNRFIRSDDLPTPTKRQWVRLAGNERAISRYGTGVAWFPRPDPLFWLDLKWSPQPGRTKQFVEDGTEQVGGVSTTRYTGGCNVALVCAGSTMQAWYDRSSADTGYFTLDVWIDGDGQIRKYAVKSSMNPGTDTYPFTITGVVSGHGAPVQVDVPPPGQYIEAATITPSPRRS